MAFNLDRFPAVLLIANDKSGVVLDDGTEVPTLELAIAYNELRNEVVRLYAQD